MSQNGTTFTYKYLNNLYQTNTKLLGKYNVYNVLTVISILTSMNIDQDKIVKIIPTLEAPVGRMQMIKYKTNNIIIDYAHTPDAIENIIETLKPLLKGKIYVVFGCTGDRDRTKRPIMTNYVANNSEYFIITNDDPHNEDENQIVNDMIQNLNKNNYEICLDRKKAIKKGIDLLKENDILLILGKGHEEFMIIKNERIPFSDYKVVMECLGDD